MTIEALEISSNEKNIEQIQEIDRLGMILADLESRELNNQLDQDEVDEIIREKPHLTNFHEAMQRISQLQRALRSQQWRIKENVKEAENYNRSLQ